MGKTSSSVRLGLFTLLSLAACKKDKEGPNVTPVPVNEQELITSVELHFHSVGGSEHKHFTFSDPDGDGGAAPVITADTLSADTIYDVEIEFLNTSTIPPVDIGQEILNEGTLHQFFFLANVANVAIAYTDQDANGLPIGLQSAWTVGAPSSGTVQIVLRHEPNKTAIGVPNGDITNAGGDTDIEVTFPFRSE